MPRRKSLRPRGRLTPALKAKVVEQLAECFAPVLAARGVGVSFETYRRHYHADPEFKKAVDEARLAYANKLRTEVHRRAVVGYEEPVFYQGVQCGKVRRFSDSLMLRHIARFDPSYREATKVEQKTTIAGSVEVQKDEVAQLPEEEKKLLRELVKARRAREARAKASGDAPRPA